MPVSGFVSAKAQALLCYLAVTRQPHKRETLATLLWGDSPDAEARANLRTVLTNLRKLVGPYIQTDRDIISFNQASPYWLDVEVFETLLTTSISDSGIQLSVQAIELYRGDFLQGFTVRNASDFEMWQISQRERFHQMALRALGIVSKQRMERGEFAAAIDYTRWLLALEPWQEEAHRQLMQLLVKSDQRSAALAQYDTCRRILAEELGVNPSDETQTLYERLRTAPASPPHNLPAQATPFVGREQELAHLAEYCKLPVCRLISLVGLGGVGKTRLALQAGMNNLALFPDGVFFVSLVAVDSPQNVIAHIATALNFSFSGPAEPETQLLNFLRPKDLLLILDNFEQLLTKDGAELLLNLLQTAPQLKLLVTSRERLDVQEEWVIDVEGLGYPDPNIQEQGRQPITNLQNYSAIVLFLLRVRRVQADFALTEANQADVVRVCQLLQGIPLGLELAATWLPVLTCTELVTEIERDLNFLTASLRNIPDRHRSLRAVFESSWHMLSDAERQVLKRLSVFRDGFRREAAIQVAGTTLPLLLGLSSKSLLRRDETGRYDMHELIRQFATEKLAETPTKQMNVLDRHCVYYAGLLQQWDELLNSSQQLEIFQAIEADYENILAAWHHAVAHVRVDNISQFLWGLWLFHEATSRYHQGYTIFSEAAQQLSDAETLTGSSRQLIYAQVMTRAGRFSQRLSRFQQANEQLQKSLALLRQFNASRDMALALQMLGFLAWGKGERERAKQQLMESAALAKQSGDAALAAFSTSGIGFVAISLGEYSSAEHFLREGLVVLQKKDRSWRLTATLIFLGRAIIPLGRYTEAEAILRDALQLSQTAGDRWSIGFCLSVLGELAGRISHERYSEGKQLQQQALTIFREVEDRWVMTAILFQLAQTCVVLGNYDEARQHLREALRIGQEHQITTVTVSALASLADVHLRAAGDQADRDTQIMALEWLTLAVNHQAIEQNARDRSAYLLTQLKAELPPPLVEAATARGQTKSLETIVTEILSATPS
ncbi:MAG: NACHT domain-containing protein [Anaerolineae bacterium]|nr:NACHT domain-containing protein [Anaerolineae bacterium]